MYKTNTSGYRGVSYEVKSKKYRAYIHIGGVKVSIGFYSDPEVAYRARSEMIIYTTQYKFPLVGYLLLAKKDKFHSEESVMDYIRYRLYEYVNESEPKSSGCMKLIKYIIKGVDGYNPRQFDPSRSLRSQVFNDEEVLQYLYGSRTAGKLRDKLRQYIPVADL